MIMSNSNESRRTPSSNNSSENGSELKKGPWTLEEDNLLIQYINCHGEGRWNSLAKYAGLNRTGKSCRLRWLNYLKPDIKRGNFTPHEQILILELHSKWGNRWSKIAQNLPGRTDNEIKNYWRTRVQKQARQLKIDSNSNKFLEAIRMCWMPRLLEKIEQNNIRNNNSSSSSSVIQNNSSSPVLVNNYQNYSAEPVVVSNVVNNISKNGEKSVEEDDCYYVEAVPSYDDAMRELEESSQDISMSECHVGGIDWLGEDLVGSTAFWNTTADDELLWRFN